MTKTLRQWPIGKPIPKGWRIARQRVSHHTPKSILIEPKPRKRVKR